MPSSESRFVLYNKGAELKVDMHQLGGKPMYLVTSAGMEPLLITRAIENNSDAGWKSVPEGREKTANEIGRLIEKHIQSNL